MPGTELPPRDPVRLTRVRNAMALPIMLGMGAAYLLGHSLGGDPGAIMATVVYAIPATIGAIMFINSSTVVDNYVRGIGNGTGATGAAVAAAEIVTAVIAND